MTKARTGWLTLGAAALMIVGALGPWAHAVTMFGTISASGSDAGDGWIVFAMALAGAATLRCFNRFQRVLILALPILSGFTGAATAAYDVQNIERAHTPE